MQRPLHYSFVASAVAGITRLAAAQAPTSAVIAGHVLDMAGRRAPGAEIVVTNPATGIAMRGVSRADGRSAQVFNVLNLLNPRWGRIETPTGASITTTNQVSLLSQVGETAGPLPQPIYRFDPTLARFSFDNRDTYYQIQLALRYTF